MDLSKYKNLSQKAEVSGHDIVPYLLDVSEYFHNNGVEVKPFPKVIISSDKQFANEIFGKTAFFDPTTNAITLYTEGRHIRDVLRSYCHELVHYHQSLRGDLKEDTIEKLADSNYTQNNKKLRKLEAEAYLSGNILMRDWSDKIKNK